MTFDVRDELEIGIKYQWQCVYELPCVCRHCHRFTTFVVEQAEYGQSDVLRKGGVLKKYDGSVNDYVNVTGYISLKDRAGVSAPDHLEKPIKDAFDEGGTCLAVGCFNAAGAMFRMCIDMATRKLLPDGEAEGLNGRTRRDLGLRLPWLFEHGLLPKDLVELSKCIREDGNDGAHAGLLKAADAEDLLDFTEALLERMYSEPERLKIAQARRDARRQPGP